MRTYRRQAYFERLDNRRLLTGDFRQKWLIKLAGDRPSTHL
jgi:hypothetical protein